MVNLLLVSLFHFLLSAASPSLPFSHHSSPKQTADHEVWTSLRVVLDMQVGFFFLPTITNGLLREHSNIFLSLVTWQQEIVRGR